jgi:uncharacterized protein (DUF58 family)
VIRITRAGWLYIALTIFLGFSAVNTGNNLIYLVTAASLSLMGISGFFGRRNLLKIDVRLDLPEEIYAKTPCPVKVTLFNRKRFLPAFLIRVHLLDKAVLVPFVDGKAKGMTYVPLHFSERGRARIGDIYLSSVFPFNFFIRYRKIPGVAEGVVFPKALECVYPGRSERGRKSRGEHFVDRTGYEAELLSVRDYIKGDPLKYIHWKASAKTGRIKTKELSSLSHQPVIIDFDRVPIKDVEEKISCITYLLLKLLKQNIPAGLRMGGVLHKPLMGVYRERIQAHKIAMLKKLALFGKED